ncbi:protein prenyltransferase alpha subunit repeat domain containing protein, putative [Babesia bigemina]|uniref:Protein farnesyltransferase/geranylgeranyltransferase type-1 subunit alpha n=1 Tax=Babesia bigemina TaxID=5866 RepID=A0A061D718_BABBI|nr:protein prenyltransferase alpha subunit repeat domain containing protein, putative [Babesia bigemina]CDR96506.1 protein prenyltransferase alpha subunit repeat domain containing protein, putative [Babesia bigemina]|eukprot:XP_012768692.1 protein prenyltransferase alpha subunit repeat domain containing protein, putative [Babesia bigemina]
MDDNIPQILENEGVVHAVLSENLGYPCDRFIPDYELLHDANCWEDIESELEQGATADDELFEIKSDRTDRQLSLYLSHLMERGEHSSRGIYVASIAIKHNPANYTAWAYRMECAETLQLSLADEMDFARKIAYESPKSYQAWQYRRRLCELHDDPYNEPEYVKLEIASSPKNHCAWSHITWLMTHFDMDRDKLHKELEFVAFLLDSDVYNNTAWVYKSFLLNNYGHMLEDTTHVQAYVSDLRRMLASPWNESLSQYLVATYTMLDRKHNGCLHLDSCIHGCLGDLAACSVAAIDSRSETTPALLTLKREVLRDKEHITHMLNICDPLQL